MAISSPAVRALVLTGPTGGLQLQINLPQDIKWKLGVTGDSELGVSTQLS